MVKMKLPAASYFLEEATSATKAGSYRVFGECGQVREIREAYQDVAHIIHERFCYNRKTAAFAVNRHP
jgi:hypothetical protein